MMKRHLLCVVLIACGGSKKAATTPPSSYSPMPTTDAGSAASLVDTARASTWSAGYEATELGGTQTKELMSARKDLDVGTVVSLVRERLSSVAVLAVADTIDKLRGNATRPWARDLLSITAKLATAASADWRPVAESGLRVLARILIAEAVVRTASKETNADVRDVLVDWTYWYLAQTDLLKDNIAPPSCEGRPKVCADIRDDKVKGSQGHLEELLHVERILEGVRLVGRLRAAHADSKLSATLVLEQLMNAESLGSFAGISARFKILDSKLDDIKKLNTELLRFERARQAMLNALVRSTKPQAQTAATDLINALNIEITLDQKRVTIQDAIGRVGGDRVKQAFADLVVVLRDVAADGDKVQQLQLVMGAEVKGRFEITSEVNEIARDIAAFQNCIAEHSTLDSLQLSDAAEAIDILKRMLMRFQRLENLTALSAEFAEAMREVQEKARGLVALLDRLSTLAELAVGTTLADVHASVRALRSVADTKLSTPVLDIVAPIIDKLADGRRLTAGDIFAAVSDVGPADLVRALGSDFDLDKACSDADSWKCWSLRLAMSVHGSLKFNGKLVTVDSNAVITSLAKLGTEARKTKPGSFHLLASVGTGALYAEKEWHPLVAEQLGASVVLFGNKKATLSLGAFASGILYRFVVDSEIADGAMFGGTVLVRLYDLVELHADVTAVLDPGDDMTSSTWHPGFIVGAQVPFGDYLERLRD